MDVQAYIESGMLEAYVLGALTESERAEVEALIAVYPELAEEVAAIEETMFSVAQAEAETPPAGLEDRIWASIQASATGDTNEPPASGHTSRSIPLGTRPARSMQVRWQRAAIWIALVGSVAANFILWNDRNKASQQSEALASRITALESESIQYQNQLAAAQKERAMMTDPDMQRVVMQSIQPGHSMSGTVFFSKSKGDMFLALKDLPVPPQGKQYQLWVIQDGKPVDMGVISNNLVSGGMAHMDKSVTGGEAFAISLENEGGSPVPTMEQIYVMGKVTS